MQDTAPCPRVSGVALGDTVGSMFGAALFFVSTFALAATRFRGLQSAARLAAASLVALGVPVLVLVVAARAGLPPSVALVIGAHAALWLAAASGARSRPPGGTLPNDGGIASAAIIAGAVAVMTALLAPVPSGTALVDPWAHLAWSRGLDRALGSYPPAFPALLATLTPLDLLAGAFRYSALVLHFTLAAQCLALAGRGAGRAWAALAALLYVLVPAGGRTEPPRAEMLGAVLLAAGAWVTVSTDLAPRTRAVALGLLVMMLLLSHVSALEMAMVAALAVAAVAGAPDGKARGALVSAVVLGGAVALALSPFLVTLLVSPGRVALVAEQPGLLAPMAPRAVAGGLGIALCGAFGAALPAALAGWRARPRQRRVLAAALLGAAVLLLAPLVLVHMGVHIPLQLFGARLVLAAALPLALFVALVADHLGRAGGIALVAALGAFVLVQVFRPVTSLQHVALASTLALGAWWVVAKGGTPARIAAAAALVPLGAVVRLWAWTPQMPVAAEWLRAQPERLVVVTNWPVTNELDALLDVPVIDGLAGRDANIALHRAGGASELHDRLDWCGAGGEVERVAAFLRERGDSAAWLVVDPRFETAWRVYRDQRVEVAATGESARYARLAPRPCAASAPDRLAGMRAALRGPRGVSPVFERDGVLIARLSVVAAPAR
jgi:hypothetical protein